MLIMTTKEYQKQWKADNVEKVQAQRKRYYAKHKDRISAYAATQYKKNKDKISEQKKEYYLNKLIQEHSELFINGVKITDEIHINPEFTTLKDLFTNKIAIRINGINYTNFHIKCKKNGLWIYTK
jgi:hypothetical protein